MGCSPIKAVRELGSEPVSYTHLDVYKRQDVKAAMREVKRALLEADVNFKVVKTFIKSVQELSLIHI